MRTTMRFQNRVWTVVAVVLAASCDGGDDKDNGDDPSEDGNVAEVCRQYVANRAAASDETQTACLAWSDDLCGAATDIGTCNAIVRGVQGTDVEFRCRWANVWEGPSEAACASAAVEQACVGTLYYGDRAWDGSFVRDDGVDTKVVEVTPTGSEMVLAGGTFCTDEATPPAACACVP